MGSKYKIIPYLTSILSQYKFSTALDAFSGSGVVSYSLKEMGKQVTANDFLNFPATVARALIENSGTVLNENDIKTLLQPNKDGRNFIQNKFEGLYFSKEDHEFLDALWSHLPTMNKYKRALAIASVCLAAARKQPRGVFTITDFRYDDGRRSLRLPLKALFLEAVEEYNDAVFDNGKSNKVICSDVFNIDSRQFDLVYLDPPYAPPKDDADYIKRYHFLEGLSVYWEGMKIMEHTKTKKIEKRFTPFAYKRTIHDALRRLFYKFKDSMLVMSYSSNSVPSEVELYGLLKEVKRDVQVYSIPHTYSFGTHETALRRQAEELIFVAK